MSRLVVALVALLALSACGGGDDDPKAEGTVTNTPAAVPTSSLPEGQPVPEALSQFRCAADAKGVWRATGVVENADTKAGHSFQVTVQVGPAATGAAALTKELANLNPGGSVEFALEKIPAADPAGPCHVQVLQLAD